MGMKLAVLSTDADLDFENRAEISGGISSLFYAHPFIPPLPARSSATADNGSEIKNRASVTPALLE